MANARFKFRNVCRSPLKLVIQSRLRTVICADSAHVPAHRAAAGQAGPLAPLGQHFMAGLLAHAPAASLFTTPTLNGYKRYKPYTLAPDRIGWGRDNRGVVNSVSAA